MSLCLESSSDNLSPSDSAIWVDIIVSFDDDSLTNLVLWEQIMVVFYILLQVCLGGVLKDCYDRDVFNAEFIQPYGIDLVRDPLYDITLIILSAYIEDV